MGRYVARSASPSSNNSLPSIASGSSTSGCAGFSVETGCSVRMMENSFERLLEALALRQVEYCTVGGLACALNGYIRSTEDVDILVRNTPENVERLLAVLVEQGEGHAAELSLADFTDEPGAIRVIESFPIDIFTVIGGKGYDQWRDHIALHTTQSGVCIPFLDASALIEIKSQSLRPRDQQDVLALKARHRRSE